MAKRHTHQTGDWSSIAVRLDEIISARTGEDPFEEALTLLVARLAHESGLGPLAAPSHVHKLLAAASSRWPGIIEPSRTSGLSAADLARCLTVLDGAHLLADHLVGLDAIFEHITSRAAKGHKGQYFTPRHVIRSIVSLMSPAPGAHVLDPACGSGGFLVHALARTPTCIPWGFDQDPRATRVARIMLAASGADPAHIARLDSLQRGTGSGVEPVGDGDGIRGHREAPRGFDLILTNPPFAGDVGATYGDHYELARGHRVERDVLFIERCIELLRPGGRFAIVLPHNKVGGESWAFVRAWLLERAQVTHVLGLGRNTFQPHTSQKACVVIGARRAAPVTRRAARDEPIRFFISERDGKDHRGRLRYDARGDVDHDLDDALGPGAPGGRHVTRTVGELGHDLVLAPERFDPRRTVRVAGRRTGARRLGDLVDIVTDNVQAASFSARARVLVLDTTHAWDGFVLARHAPIAPSAIGSAKRALAPGDVIVSRLRPYLRQIALVDDGLFALAPGGNAVIASTEFYVLRRKPGRAAGAIDPAGLVPYLLSAPVQAALAAGQEGGHHPRFEREQLENLPVPATSPARAAAVAARVRAHATSLRTTLADSRALVADVERRLAPKRRA